MSEVVAAKRAGWAITSDDAGGKVKLRLRPYQTDPTGATYLDDEDAELLWASGADEEWQNSAMQELLGLALAGIAAEEAEKLAEEEVMPP